ncbi:MAG: AAA family ATPase [Nostocaceae cyanobacterium]|nr:AAA family ATPase [Nostocaceae cyanobacterium]
MFLKKIELLNYKSYINSTELDFSPGINIIIGQNNSGKTALLEALALRLISNPHRSIKTLPSRFSKIEEQSKAKITLTIDKFECLKLIEQIPPPLGVLEPDDNRWSGEPEIPERLINHFNNQLNQEGYIDLQISLSSDINKEVQSIFVSPKILDHLSGNQDKEYSYIQIYLQDGTITADLEYSYTDYENTVGYKIFTNNYKQLISYKIFDLFRNRIYRFYAERLNISSCFYSGSYDLKPDASNLAEVLCLLSTKNPSQSSRLNKLISIIFPHIEFVSSIQKADSMVEVVIWSVEAYREEREDLTLPLSACGTGLSQVIAILYIVITSVFPRTIIIDEPQSFLHPGAAKKLIEILKEFPQHQYFIATHSPMLITAAYPSRIIKIVHDGCESEAFVIQPDKLEDQLEILDEVGVSLSDVFGADNILWVEGPTEEKCFPLILEKVAKKPLRGTKIIGVQSTGQLEGKNAKLIFEIYDRLSGGIYLLPPMIRFILDREGKDQAELNRRRDVYLKDGRKVLEFLPSRMYENYLLLPEAITHVINKDDTSREIPLNQVEVSQWIEKHKYDKKYFSNLEQVTHSIEHIHAAKLLEDLFSELSETRVEFKKPHHPYELTKWIVENQPKFLSDLAQFLVNIIENG